MTTLPIPKIYWDVFQSALQSKVKRLAKEIAASLGQPEQPLLKALVAEKVEAYLFEEEGSEFIDLPSMRCKHYRPSSENQEVLTLCNQPVLLGKSACLQHETKERHTVLLPRLKEVTDPETGTSYWVNSDNSVKEKTDLEKSIGYYNAEKGRIYILKVSE
jgi:hypothetical protein